jgi:hypothetical protein
VSLPVAPYTLAARVAWMLESSAAATIGYLLPTPVVQKHMSPGVVAAPGSIVSVTLITSSGLSQPGCAPVPQYTMEVIIARPCAVEFATDGTTIDPEADRIADMLSDDATLLWAVYCGFTNPSLNWQITGGIGITTMSFSTNAFDVPEIPEEPVEEIVQIFASDTGASADNQ